jgi:non-lysosomal glucosylceramidase
VAFDPTRGAYVDARVARGFPLGGIGAGGLGFNTDGSFGEFRLTNNWMCPVRAGQGSFHALFTRRSGERRLWLLRRTPPAGDYDGVANVASTVFAGMLPGFRLEYRDADLPLAVTLHGFTPHVPHDVRDSTLPAAVFRFSLENAGGVAVDAALLFALENVLGRGGSGHLGLVLGAEQEVRGVRRRVAYDSVEGNFQEVARVGPHSGVRFRTAQQWAPTAHRRSVTGELLLLAEAGADLEVTVSDGFAADAPRPMLLDDFAADGRICSRDGGRRGEDGVYRPAGAVAVRTTVPPGGAREIVFVLGWWTADHVTDPDLGAEPATPPRGVRVGHVYETHFAGPEAVAAHVLAERVRLEAEAAALPDLLAASSLPPWLVRVVANSIDSTLCNTIVPASGRLYTLEGMDWHWPMGGLTGTNDQRLSAHPYTATFFPDLDESELDEFRRLADGRGAIPHGNGNCDLALGSTDVPYGWPMFVKDLLPAKEWTDLTMSFVLQVARHWRTRGRPELLERFWPALVRGMEYLAGLAPHDVPEGGTTYDIWDVPGAFAYSATLYLASLRAMAEMAATAEPTRAATYAARFARCVRRVDAELWSPDGYLKTSENKPTVFTAALAGDWAARWIGLGPVVDPGRAASHLRLAQRVLVDEAVRAAAGRWRPLPRAEAHPDGTPVVHPMAAGLPEGEEITYVWQVLSYQAMEAIYVGLVDDGLEIFRLVADRLWHDGNAWSAGLRGNAESVYMTHPVAWAILHALTGAALDVPGRTLEIGPRVPQGERGLRCPFFFPGFWAVLDYDVALGSVAIEVVRSFGDPVVVERVGCRGAAGAHRIIALEAPRALERGCRLRLQVGDLR